MATIGVVKSQAQTNNVAPSRSIALDESSNGRTVRAEKGQVLVVRLKETDPGQTWHFTGGNGFTVVSDTTLESFPMQHVFRVKVRRPGDLAFAKVERLSQRTVETFTVRVVIDEKEPAAGPDTLHPLSGPDVLRQRLIPFHPWR